MNITSTLCEKMLVEKTELFSFIHTAPRRYKTYYIAKRNSTQKRLIAQPAKSVKFMQGLAVEELRLNLRIHECAMAYEKGVGIKRNAQQHCNNQYLLKMDFKNFFLSITPELFFLVAERSGVKFCDDDKFLLSNLLFWKLRRNSPLRLSIGAPSSPFVSNFVMSNFDSSIQAACRDMGVTYTRYADDLTFTTNKKGILFGVQQLVRDELKVHCNSKIRINSEKTIFSSKAFNRHITGITITNEGKLSVGRDKKRLVSSMIHRFSLGLLNESQAESLKGRIAHINNIEPGFHLRIQSKYGKEVMDRLYKSKFSN